MARKSDINRKREDREELVKVELRPAAFDDAGVLIIRAPTKQV